MAVLNLKALLHFKVMQELGPLPYEIILNKNSVGYYGFCNVATNRLCFHPKGSILPILSDDKDYMLRKGYKLKKPYKFDPNKSEYEIGRIKINLNFEIKSKKFQVISLKKEEGGVMKEYQNYYQSVTLMKRSLSKLKSCFTFWEKHPRKGPGIFVDDSNELSCVAPEHLLHMSGEIGYWEVNEMIMIGGGSYKEKL